MKPKEKKESAVEHRLIEIRLSVREDFQLGSSALDGNCFCFKNTLRDLQSCRIIEDFPLFNAEAGGWFFVSDFFLMKNFKTKELWCHHERPFLCVSIAVQNGLIEIIFQCSLNGFDADYQD